MNRILLFVIALTTAIIGMEINHSVFWAVIDFFFWPFAWIKWAICQEVNLTVIKSAFSFFLR